MGYTVALQWCHCKASHTLGCRHQLLPQLRSAATTATILWSAPSQGFSSESSWPSCPSIGGRPKKICLAAPPYDSNGFFSGPGLCQGGHESILYGEKGGGRAKRQTKHVRCGLCSILPRDGRLKLYPNWTVRRLHRLTL